MILSLILTLLVLVSIYLIHSYIISPLFLIRKYREKGVNNVYFVPFIGIGFYFMRDMMRHNDSLYFLKEFVKKNPNAKYLISNMGANLCFIFIDPEYIKELLIKNISKTNADHSNALDPIFGRRNIVFSEGEGWKIRRKLHSYGFTFENVRKLTPIVVEISDKYLKQMADNDSDSTNVLLSLFTMTGEFMLRAVFGTNLTDKRIEGQLLVDYQFSLIDIMFKRMLKIPFLFFGKKYYENALFGQEKRNNNKAKLLRKVITEEIEKIKEENKNNDQRKEVKLMDYLIENMENNKDLKNSDINLTNEFLSLVGAGVETTSHLILNCLIFLNNHLKYWRN